MNTITRDPETLPTNGSGPYAVPWHPQPSIFDALVVDLQYADGKGRTIEPSEIEEILATDRTHRGFLERQKLPVAGLDTRLSFDDWVHWQKHRDPIREDPDAAELVRQSWVAEARGPGIAKRTPGATKKARSTKGKPAAGKAKP